MTHITSLRKKIFAYTLRGKIIGVLEAGILSALVSIVFGLLIINLIATDVVMAQRLKRVIYLQSVIPFLIGSLLSLALEKSFFCYRFFTLSESDIYSYKKAKEKRLQEEIVEHETTLKRIDSELKNL